jgi:hypothetical protein
LSSKPTWATSEDPVSKKPSAGFYGNGRVLTQHEKGPGFNTQNHKKKYELNSPRIRRGS